MNISKFPPQPGLTLVVNYFQMMLQEREISPESDDISTVSSRDNITVMTTRRSLGRSAALQRFGSQQDRWKQQVRRLELRLVVPDLLSSFTTSGPRAADTDIRPTHDAQLNTPYLFVLSVIQQM